MFPVIYSEDFLQHKTGVLHPERPERLTAIVEALNQASFSDQIEWKFPTPLTQRGVEVQKFLHKIHTQEHIERVERISQKGGGYLDGDTPLSARSYEIALLAISAWFDGVDQVIKSHGPAFVLARPPGHHAESDRGMGFCLFSNAAISAYYALEKPGIKRVAILDWDVHHGNGTQAIMEDHPQIFYCSLHQSPCYPGTGYPNERGSHENVLNLPMYPGMGSSEYKSAFRNQVIPFLQQCHPDLLIVSAGYDANAADPLASINLIPEDFSEFTRQCLSVTPRILFGLEGGYALKELGLSVVATIEACLNLQT